MGRIILNPTDISQWYALVNQAESDVSLQLPEDLESYLVMLLHRYSVEVSWVSDIVAEEYLKSQCAVGKVKELQLKNVGDKCLLFSGFFPEQAERRQVSDDYFIDMGRFAYASLACRQAEESVYAMLSEDFKNVVAVMQGIRS